MAKEILRGKNTRWATHVGTLVCGPHRRSEWGILPRTFGPFFVTVVSERKTKYKYVIGSKQHGRNYGFLEKG
jgi:hypothetical protein